MPGKHDGMAAFAGGGGTTILVRNHELEGSGGEGSAVEGRRPYDRSEPGGTTAIVLGPDRRKLRESVTSSGSRLNCAGGRTPWGTWLTCEEDLTEDHGYVFEVVPGEDEGVLSREPIRAMGSFSHEAVAIDPRTGVVYLTEDAARGGVVRDEQQSPRLESFLYRFLPADRSRRAGALQRGGRLQALALEERDGARPGGSSGGERSRWRGRTSIRGRPRQRPGAGRGEFQPARGRGLRGRRAVVLGHGRRGARARSDVSLPPRAEYARVVPRAPGSRVR